MFDHSSKNERTKPTKYQKEALVKILNLMSFWKLKNAISNILAEFRGARQNVLRNHSYTCYNYVTLLFVMWRFKTFTENMLYPCQWKRDKLAGRKIRWEVLAVLPTSVSRMSKHTLWEVIVCLLLWWCRVPEKPFLTDMYSEGGFCFFLWVLDRSPISIFMPYDLRRWKQIIDINHYIEW